MLLGNAHPGAEVDFINGLRCSQGVAGATLLHPLAVVPLVVKIPDHGRGARRLLMHEAKGVSLVDLVAVSPRLDMKFVERTFRYTGDEAFPDTGRAPRSEQVRAWIPRVEAADYRNQARIRCPHAEHCSSLSVAQNQMSAHGFVKAIVAALVEKVKILIGEQGWAVAAIGWAVRHFRS